jgi:hypothetical protein
MRGTGRLRRRCLRRKRTKIAGRETERRGGRWGEQEAVGWISRVVRGAGRVGLAVPIPAKKMPSEKLCVMCVLSNYCVPTVRLCCNVTGLPTFDCVWLVGCDLHFQCVSGTKFFVFGCIHSLTNFFEIFECHAISRLSNPRTRNRARLWVIFAPAEGPDVGVRSTLLSIIQPRPIGLSPPSTPIRFFIGHGYMARSRRRVIYIIRAPPF